MKAIRRIAPYCVLALVIGLSNGVQASGEGGFGIEKAHNELKNTSSLQRGARNYMNYCVGCHSLKYVRYNRLGQDLGLSEDQLKDNLIFGVDRINANVTSAMTKEQGAEWFSAAPPDLSLVGRSRGVDWLYTYLKSFYADDSRPFGVNNAVVEGVSMPHVLWELQGMQEAVYRSDTMIDDNGNEKQVEVLDHLNLTRPGKMSAAEYDGFVRDTVNFLDYVGEPMKMKRKSIGMMVLGFLAIFGLLVYALKIEYWKDID